MALIHLGEDISHRHYILAWTSVMAMKAWMDGEVENKPGSVKDVVEYLGLEPLNAS